jgi:hypothetical protein
MLSPKAMNRETVICGGRETVTANEQLAVSPAPEPVAAHATVVEPTLKDAPDAGEHVT